MPRKKVIPRKKRIKKLRKKKFSETVCEGRCDGKKWVFPCKGKVCEHLHVKTATRHLVPIEDSDLKGAELICDDCGESIGIIYGKKGTLPEEEINYKIIVGIDNENDYVYRIHRLD